MKANPRESFISLRAQAAAMKQKFRSSLLLTDLFIAATVSQK
jgi:hypothetical protein